MYGHSSEEIRPDHFLIVEMHLRTWANQSSGNRLVGSITRDVASTSTFPPMDNEWKMKN